ncbi:MAG: hypothetical protein ACK57F_09625 [Pseudomonadota bacterium]
MVAARRRHDAARDQHRHAVVVQRDDFVRTAVAPLEADAGNRIPTALAMPGAEFLRGRGRRMVLGAAGESVGTGGARFGLRLRAVATAPRGRRFLRDRRTMEGPFAEHGDADHAHVVRTAGARGVGIRQFGEVELGALLHRLAPAADLGALPRAQHVAGLRGARGLAGHGVDAVHAEHRQQALAGAVFQHHAVAVARRARHEHPPAVAIQGQFATVGGVVQPHVDQAAVAGLAGARGGEQGEGGEQASHGVLRVGPQRAVRSIQRRAG